MTRTRRALIVAGAWSVGVILALVVTLDSLAADDFDGLNNAFQIPFALPWFLLPLPAITQDHVADAWITAGMGLINAAIIFLWIARSRPDVISN